MKRQEIMDLLSKSDQEKKDYILSKNIKLSEFCSVIEDMKLNTLMGPNHNRILYNQLCILKIEVIDIIHENRNNALSKPCNESKFRLLLQSMIL